MVGVGMVAVAGASVTGLPARAQDGKVLRIASGEADGPSGTIDPLVPPGPWFQFHYDRWSVPDGATEVARNALASQAFVAGRSLAVQFHPELTAATLEGWLSEGGEEQVRRDGQDPGAALACAGGELRDQPGLADAGFAGDQHERGLAGAGSVECCIETIELRGTPDEDRARDAGHGVDHRTRPR